MTDNAARPASTILLVRDGPTGLELFMVVRHHQIDFATGAMVFPGGSAEESDFTIADDTARVAPIAGIDRTGLAMRVAAIRETFEESGILLARPRGGTALVDGAMTAQLLKDWSDKPFAAMLAAHDLELAIDRLVHYAHWVTPTMMPKRFDTHFYMAAAPHDQFALHDGHEAVDSIWINPAEALKAAEAGRYTIIFPTRLNLGLIAQCTSVEDAMASTRARKIVTVMPEAVKDAPVRSLRIPIEAGYGGDVFPMG